MSPKKKSFWIPVVLFYSVGGIAPLLALMVIALPFYNQDVVNFTLLHHSLTTAIIVVALFIMDWFFMKLAARIVRRYYEAPNRVLVLFVSGAGLGFSVLLTGLFSILTIQNQLPDYAGIPVNYPDLLISSLSPTVTIFAIFFITGLIGFGMGAKEGV